MTRIFRGEQRDETKTKGPGVHNQDAVDIDREMYEGESKDLRRGGVSTRFRSIEPAAFFGVAFRTLPG